MHQSFETDLSHDTQIDLVLHLSLRLALAQDLGFPVERPLTASATTDKARLTRALPPVTRSPLTALLALRP